MSRQKERKNKWKPSIILKLVNLAKKRRVKIDEADITETQWRFENKIGFNFDEIQEENRFSCRKILERARENGVVVFFKISYEIKSAVHFQIHFYLHSPLTKYFYC